MQRRVFLGPAHITRYWQPHKRGGDNGRGRKRGQFRKQQKVMVPRRSQATLLGSLAVQGVKCSSQGPVVITPAGRWEQQKVMLPRRSQASLLESLAVQGVKHSSQGPVVITSAGRCTAEQQGSLKPVATLLHPCFFSRKFTKYPYILYSHEPCARPDFHVASAPF